MSAKDYSTIFHYPLGIKVNDISYLDSATVVSLTYTGAPYSWIRLANSTYASDENSVRHHVIRTEGIQLGERLWIGDDGRVSFTLYFDPLPKGTKLFDIIEGDLLGGFYLYGIHKAGTKARIPKADSTMFEKEVEASAFKPDSAFIRGCFKGYSRQTMPELWLVGYRSFQVDPFDMSQSPTILKVEPDGTFHCGFLVDSPKWTYLDNWSNRHLNFYIRPGDTLDMQIDNFGQWNETISYKGVSGRPCYGNLMRYNKEAIWVAQMDYTPGQDNWPLGGSGDSWWRMHKPVLEATWAPWIPRGGKNGTRVDELNGNKTFYIFTADAVCFEKVEPKYLDKEDPKDTLDTDAPETKRWLEIKDGGTPAADPDAAGRKLAWTFGSSSTAKLDSLANRSIGNGGSADLGLYASEFIVRPAGSKLGSYWDDPNDFRGSETMIQRDYYTPSGKKWSEVKKEVKARVAAGLYNVTAADTVNITPRFWKFSDDKHIMDNNNCYYDTDWYMIRIAETYLLRAEARLAQGNKSGAAEDINVLRNRAGAKPCTAADIDIDYILDERVRELFGEEQRWVTLSRLSCNPNATYVLDKYPTQNATTSNTFYERTRKYGFGYENEDRGRETYTDALGNIRHRPNIMPHNYVLPIPIQIIQSNKDKEIPQNYGYK